MSKINLIILISALTLFAQVPTASAFTDEVGANPERVWKAVKDVFSVTGLHVEDWENREIQTNWIRDEVRRSRGFFKGVFHQLARRRYRFDISVTKGEAATQLRLNVTVEEKSRNGTPSIPWQKVKPDSEDYILERDYFHKILEQLSAQLSEAQVGSETPVSPYTDI